MSKEQEEAIIEREKAKLKRDLELKLRKEYEDKMAAELATVVTEHHNSDDIKRMQAMEERLREMENTNKRFQDDQHRRDDIAREARAALAGGAAL